MCRSIDGASRRLRRIGESRFAGTGRWPPRRPGSAGARAARARQGRRPACCTRGAGEALGLRLPEAAGAAASAPTGFAGEMPKRPVGDAGRRPCDPTPRAARGREATTRRAHVRPRASAHRSWTTRCSPPRPMWSMTWRTFIAGPRTRCAAAGPGRPRGGQSPAGSDQVCPTSEMTTRHRSGAGDREQAPHRLVHAARGSGGRWSGGSEGSTSRPAPGTSARLPPARRGWRSTGRRRRSAGWRDPPARRPPETVERVGIRGVAGEENRAPGLAQQVAAVAAVPVGDHPGAPVAGLDRFDLQVTDAGALAPGRAPPPGGSGAPGPGCRAAPRPGSPAGRAQRAEVGVVHVRVREEDGVEAGQLARAECRLDQPARPELDESAPDADAVLEGRVGEHGCCRRS